MPATGNMRPRFDALPRPASDWALFLYLDGTIAEIAPRPEAASVSPAGIEALTRIRNALGGALALVTGRGLADLDRIGRPLHLPAAGQHGAEWRMPDGVLCRVPGASAGELDGVCDAFLAYAARHPGVIVEEKGLSLSVHFRLAPAAAEEIHALAEDLADGDRQSTRLKS